MKFLLPVLLTGSFLLGGCTQPMGKGPAVDLPENGHVHARAATHVQPARKPAVVVRTVERPRLRDLSAGANDPLPAVEVGPFAAADMPLVDLLDAVSYDSGVAFAYGGADLKDKTLSLVDPGKVPLSTAIRRIASASDLFWRFEDGVLRLEPTRSFAVEVPKVAGVAEALTAALEGVGAENVVQSSATGGLVFEASPSVKRKVAGLVDEWASERSMITYDGYIYEIQRDRSGKSGIEMEALKSKLQKIANTQIDNVGDGFTVTSDATDLVLDILISDLQSASSSRVLSQPTLAVVSGGTATVDVGEKQQFVSSISTTSNDSSSTQDVQIDSVNSGLKLQVTGEHNAGVITTELNLELSTLLGFETFDTGSAEIKLPNTAERNLEQVLLGRPGDVLVLAGVMTDSIQETESGAHGRRSQRSKTTSMDELIVILRPRLVRFQ